MGKPSQNSLKSWRLFLLIFGLLALVSVLLVSAGNIMTMGSGPAIEVGRANFQAAGPKYAELELLKEVMPGAATFTERDGQPPVFRAYLTDPDSKERKLLGYVFLTPDLPPEEVGNSAPIEVLVG